MIEEQPVKTAQTTWERLEQESQERIAKYDPMKFKEMVERWSGGLTEEETETDRQND